jgi:hypothetical protein
MTWLEINWIYPCGNRILLRDRIVLALGEMYETTDLKKEVGSHSKRGFLTCSKRTIVSVIN